MSDYGLSPQQIAVICALSCGANMTAAAEQAGVHRNTIANWRRNSLPFQQGFAHAQYDRALYYREKVEDLVDLALKCIQAILTDPETPPSVKLKAALAIMSTACTPPAPKKQVELDIEKIVSKRTPPETLTEEQLAPAPPVHNIAQPTKPAAQPPVHNIAQPKPEIRVNSRPFAANSPDAPAMHNSAQLKRAEVARNAKCPCGSGKKYKRCCLDAARVQPAATTA